MKPFSSESQELCQIHLMVFYTPGNSVQWVEPLFVISPIFCWVFSSLYICIYPIMFPGLLQITVKVLWITLASVTDLSILTLLSFLYSVSFFCLLSICHYLLSFSLSVISLVFIICHYYLIFSFLSLSLLCYSIPFILFIQFASFTLLFSFSLFLTNFSVSFSRMFR